MNILGLKISGHDTGACLVYGNKIVAISEERLNRIKHSFNDFPRLSIGYCLDYAEIKPQDIDLVVIDQIGHKKDNDFEKLFRQSAGDEFAKIKVEVINHHLAHAASAFFASSFEEAAIMVMDGAGEKIDSHLGTSGVETETTYYGFGNTIYEIQKTIHRRDGKKFISTFGIGKLYSFLTEKYARLGRYNEGKTMGLASYGKGILLDKFPLNYWYKELNGHYLCNANIRYPVEVSFNRAERLLGNPRLLPVKLKVFVKTKLKDIKVIFKKRFCGQGENVILFPDFSLLKPPRDLNQKLPDDYYAEIAFIFQKVLEEIFVGMSRRLHAITSSKNLCLAGGVSLNGVANNKILEDGKFKNLFVQPASSDCGIPLGCALWGYHCYFNNIDRSFEMRHAYLGKKYSENHVLKALNARDDIKFYKSNNAVKEAADLIADKKIIAWFYNGSEYGPRALGSRSILCDPRPKEMKDILNSRVKHREGWRPFAASVLEEKVSDYFELDCESPFMLLVPKIKKDKLNKIPALVHVDETCRIQSVNKQNNGIYFDLISEFYKLTGVPMILNTSFNVAGEPIVETPEDALRCFAGTDIDYLIMENYIISRIKK